MSKANARLLENLEKPRSTRARARAAESLCRGVCVRPKHALRAFLNPHTPKMRLEKTATRIVVRLETRDERFLLGREVSNDGQWPRSFLKV